MQMQPMLAWKMDLHRVILSFFVHDMTNRMAPILRSSKKLDRVTKSPLASETLALSEVAVLIGTTLQEAFRLPKSFVKQTMHLW